jgi:hypothetical protein
MLAKILGTMCVVGLLLSPTLASAERFSRGECENLVKEKLGNPGQPRGEIRAAVARCMRHGPDAIVR